MATREQTDNLESQPHLARLLEELRGIPEEPVSVPSCPLKPGTRYRVLRNDPEPIPIPRAPDPAPRTLPSLDLISKFPPTESWRR